MTQSIPAILYVSESLDISDRILTLEGSDHLKLSGFAISSCCQAGNLLCHDVRNNDRLCTNTILTQERTLLEKKLVGTVFNLLGVAK